MTKSFCLLALWVVLAHFQSCSNERVARASKDGIDIVIISKKGSCFVVIDPDSGFSTEIGNQNYLEVKIKGGIVPVNHLVLFKDTNTGKVFVGYSGEVINKKLDSTYVFFENSNDVCYDVQNITTRRKCVDFDLFYVLNGSYR